MNETDQKIIEFLNKYESSWVPSYGRFSKAISTKKLSRGAEIGVAFGGHAEDILRKTKVERLYGIDPFAHIPGYDDPMNLPQNEFDALHTFTKKRLSNFGNRYVHIRKTSAEAAKLIENNLDFVYIDADHSYEGVKDDLSIWYSKVREGGIIGGHDYDHVNFPGVKKAVDELFGPSGSKIHEEGTGVWWAEKNSPKVSFIMPAYNAADTIKESVESIFDNNFLTGDELIIVDDCSTDKTAQVLKVLHKKHPEIRLISHAFNKGGGAARNTAIDNAKHDLIFCLDSDNILEPGSVPLLRDYQVVSRGDVITFGAVKYFKKSPKKFTHQWKYGPRSTTLEGALSDYKFPGASGNYLFTKKSWMRAGRYPDFAGAFDTWGFGFRQLASGSKMTFLADTFYYHRYGHDSYWMREAKTGRLSLKALQLLIPYLDLLDHEDVNYIMAEGTRDTWFDNLEQRPIKLKQANKPKPSFRNRIKGRLKRNDATT
jgi:glycosyltransferase involved in cell wall biosynthesis